MMQRQFREIRWWPVIILGAMLVLVPIVVSAHGGPELRVTPSIVVPGATIEVEGEGLTENGDITITLEGLTFEATLGTVNGDEEGAFVVEFTIPEDAPPGIYLVRAVGSDAKTASFEITVNPALGEEEEAHGESGPTAEEAPLERPRADGQVPAVVFALLVSAAAGFFLVGWRE